MLLRAIAIFSLFFMSLGNANLSFAEEGQAKETLSKDAASALFDSQNKALQEKVSALLKTLTLEESQHFLVMYSNYNIYSMVKAVRDDVESAVNECAKNNKLMANDLIGRFAEWDDVVGDNMKEANANIQNLALAQVYMPQSELKTLFGLVDEVRAVNSSRFETAPVTTPEACEFMLSKMDETQDSMVQMLKTTLISYPNLLKKTQK